MTDSGARAAAASDRSRARPLAFYAGVFLLCMSTLMLQVVQTRILSVISFYHLAFFAISMAMFGMAAGAILVYVRRSWFGQGHLSYDLTWITVAFAWAVAICFLVELTTTITLPRSLTLVVIWVKLIVLLFVPFFFAGMGVSLALTLSPFRVGIVYGADLLGAAMGCLAALAVLQWIDAISAVFVVSALGAAAAACFARAGLGEPRPRAAGQLGLLRFFGRPLGSCAVFLSIVVVNLALAPHGLSIVFAKDRLLQAEAERWNSFSHIGIKAPVNEAPFLWGPSPLTPEATIEQRFLQIDAEAGTPMYRFDGDLEQLDFLPYDITTLAYRIRHQGRSAVIGIGGGRDMLSAYYFGFRDVTGVELNPIFVDWLTGRYREFAGVANLPGLTFEVDEARSWFARSRQEFDLIQMSLIDTWAATGAGAFSLTENGLYTSTAWRRFLDRLSPSGVLTVSRWKSSAHIDETGRALSLAMAALFEEGAADPSAHIFLAATDTLSTLVVGRMPLSPSDVRTLEEECARLQFEVLFSPTTPGATPALRQIAGARAIDDLLHIDNAGLMDLSPPTDERPFFFNQLKLGNPLAMFEEYRSRDSGVVKGNLQATFSLFMIIVLSTILVVAVVLLPARHSARESELRPTLLGTAYFLLIGMGFMLIEIAYIQRMSVFIGHPVHSMAIVLFGIIVSTGIGSLLSERVRLRTAAHLVAWGLLLVLYVAVFPMWFRHLALQFEGASLVVRAAICLFAIVPSGVLLGFGFPNGMRLVSAIDARPTPWFWGVNGAAGVLAAGLAVGINIQISTNASLWLGALCYAAIVPIAVLLAQEGRARAIVLRGPPASRSTR